MPLTSWPVAELRTIVAAILIALALPVALARPGHQALAPILEGRPSTLLDTRAGDLANSRHTWLPSGNPALSMAAREIRPGSGTLPADLPSASKGSRGTAQTLIGTPTTAQLSATGFPAAHSVRGPPAGWQ